MILQLALIFGFLALGELAVHLAGISFPGSIVGMLALTLALQLKVVKLRHVERAASFLMQNMGLFFVPAGVSVMLHFGLIRAQLLPICVAVLVSTVAVLAVTGLVHQLVRNISRK